jgi:hypothetical protein
VRKLREKDRYRMKPLTAAAAAACADNVPFSDQSVARAQSLRDLVKRLK